MTTKAFKKGPKSFNAVRFMRERKKRIGNETESMNFLQLKAYFDRMNMRLQPPISTIAPRK